jgi:hypothetical protein
MGIDTIPQTSARSNQSATRQTVPYDIPTAVTATNISYRDRPGLSLNNLAMSRIVSKRTRKVTSTVQLKYMLNATPVRATPWDSAPPCHTSSECVIIKQPVTPAHTGLMKLTDSLIAAHRIVHSVRVKNIFSWSVCWI